MRHTIALATLLALTTISAARAAEWCGYSSPEQCKQSPGDRKNGYCMPNPGFASAEQHIRFALK